MSLLRRLGGGVLGGLLAGAASGAAALALDLLLVRLLVATSTPLYPRYVIAYLAVGAAFGLLVSPAAVFARGRLHPAAVAAWAFGLLYVLPIGERVYRQIYWRPPVLVWSAVAVVVVGYLVFLFVLGRVARRPADDSGARLAPPPLAPFLAGVCAAVGLAVNRFVVDRPLDPEALAADLVILLSVTGLAFLARGASSGWKAPVTVVGAAVLAAAAVVALRPAPLPGAEIAAAAPAHPDGERPPHLVLLVIDTLRQDVFHDVLHHTPEGRRLGAALGPAAHFTHAVAAAPWTPPSMGTIFTGFYPREHGFVSGSEDRRRWAYRRLSPEAPTLAERLGERGWWTEAIGSNPILHAGTGIERGFHEFRLLSGLTVRLPLLTALARMNWIRGEYYQPASAVVGRFERRFGRVVEACEEPGCRAFFWVHLTDPHHPLHRRETFEEDREAVRGGDETRALYRSEVRYAVRWVTEMLEVIAAAGAADETLFVLVSDHGEMLPGDRPGAERVEPHYGHGHVLYEPVLRVPLVIRPPGLDAGREIDALVSHADLHDTILDLLGVGGDRVGRDRRSLAPWVRGEPAEGRDWVLFSHTHHGPDRVRGLRVGGAKLIWSPEEEKHQLFDLGRDPEETVDVSARDPEAVELLHRRLDEIWASLGTAEEGGEVELDEETRRQLEALGYI